MGRARRLAAAVLGCTLSLAGCGGGSGGKANPQPDPSDTPEASCSAGLRRCVGLKVLECSADGTAETLAETCPQGQTCFDGACIEPHGEPSVPDKPPVNTTTCTADAKSCQGGNVYLCRSDGTGVALLQACLEGQTCDGELLACRPRVCDPGKVTCEGTRALTCNAFGSAWLSNVVDCAANGKVCLAGVCVVQECTPNSAYCQGGNVYFCNNSGNGGDLLRVCEPKTQYCEGNVAVGVGCRQNECEIGKAVCDGNTAKVCGPDGKLPPAGTDCGPKHYCGETGCTALTCTPGVSFCEGDELYECDERGPPRLVAYCGVDTCKAGPDGATCDFLPE